MNKGHTFLERTRMRVRYFGGDKAKDKDSQEKGITGMDRESRQKRQRAGGVKIDRGRIQSSKQSYV